MAKVMSRLKPVARGGYARPFTRAELERMYDAGILHPDEKIELISGELIAKELPMKKRTRYGDSSLRPRIAEGLSRRGGLSCGHAATSGAQ
jgi:ATP-dependent RNA circularization protein (DNA/RNA ligase family)